jgi:uncharacterized protein YciI
MTTVTQAEFARMERRDRAYITRLKQAGRLVMAGDKVDVEASRARIAETSDPNRDDVKERWQAERAAPTAVPQGDFQKVAVNAENAEKIGNSYQAARAVKEKFAAMQAKLDYERAIGKLIEKADASAAIEDVTSVIRQALENLPHRTAPELVGKDLDGIRATLKQEVHAALADMEREFTKRLNQMGSEE